MTLPTTGPLSMSQIATELNTPVGGLSLSNAAVRNLAGIPSGPISFSDLRGKSSMTVTGQNNTALYQSNGSSGTATAFPSVVVAGGVAPYTFQWNIDSVSGLALTLSQATSQTCRVSRGFTRYQNFVSTASLTCVVTDAAGTQRSVSGVTGRVEVESNA